MTAVILFFAVGVLLLALEVVVPGAILGIAGGIAMFVGVLIAFDQFGPNGGLLAAGVAIAAVGITLYLEFVLLPKSRLARKFSMSATVDAQSQPAIADRAAVVGRRAIAVTALAPSGYVELGDRRYEAFSRSGLIPAGAAIDIVDVDNFRLIVSKTTASTLETKCPSG